MPELRTGDVGLEELAQASRNHAMPLEALRYPITPEGLHYLLIHYDIPETDAVTWRVEVGGHVDRPLRLSIEDLRARPAVTTPVTLECAGNGRALLSPRPVSQPWLDGAVGTAAWTGTPLAPLLREAGVGDGAVEVAFRGADRGIEGGEDQRYERSLPLEEALRDDVLLVYAMNDRPLLPQHGAPLRLIVPGWYGMAHVKWLDRIRVLTEPFDGYQNVTSYRRRHEEEEPGEPVTRIRPRSLMIPPGWPSFPDRGRTLEAGEVTLRGRAWSGTAPIERVEVSTDGGASWTDAELEPPLGPYAWRGWSFAWRATPGEHELRCRATDATGEAQPDEGAWNLGAFENNAVQRVRVTVEP
jgi:DMSO/TMAO reductase YedYZ molybdopterin-dependent catalytic subunit